MLGIKMEIAFTSEYLNVPKGIWATGMLAFYENFKYHFFPPKESVVVMIDSIKMTFVAITKD